MTHRQIFIVVFISLVTLVRCGKTTDFDKCDLEKGRFIRGEHYVASKFLNEEKQWNYQEWNKYQIRKARYIASKKCSLARLELKETRPTQSSEIQSDLSNSTESFETQVEDFEETIDLIR